MTKRITPHEVLRAYDVLTHFRNLCAHDERLYCAKVGNDDYATMLKLMEVALPRDVVFETKKDIEHLLVKTMMSSTLSRRKTSESNWGCSLF